MPTVPVLLLDMLAYHGTHSEGAGNGLAILLVFLGVIATAGWLIFSELKWAHTVSVAAGGWAAGLTLAWVF